MALNGDLKPGFKLESLITRFAKAPPLGLAGRFAVTAAAMGVAMLLRAAVAGIAPNAGVSQTFFVAIIIATLFCGLGWGVVTLGIGAGVSIWFWSGHGVLPLNANQEAGLIMYLISGLCVTFVAAALRSTMVRVNEAQNARLVSEARLGLTQSAGGVGLWEWNAVTDELYWSPAFRMNMGIPLDAPAAPQTFIDHLHPDDRDRVLAIMEAGRATQDPYEMDYRPAPRDGQAERWLHGRGESFFENGRLARGAGR